MPFHNRNQAPPRPNPNSLGGIVNRDFRQEFNRLQEGQPGLEERFLDQQAAPIDFEAFRGSLSALAESVTSDLFGAGGAVEKAQQGARGKTVTTGFGTGSGGLTNATQNIFRGARDEVANVVGRGAIDIAGIAVQDRATTLGNLNQFVQFQGGRLDDLRDSLFGGQATIEQLRLAERQLDQNQQVIDQGEGGGFLSTITFGLL